MFAELARRSLNQIQLFTSKIFSTLYTGAYFFSFLFTASTPITTFFIMTMLLVSQYFFSANERHNYT
jgi:hypothetical protein